MQTGAMLVHSVAACLLVALVAASPEEDKLLQSLLRDYSSTSRPVHRANDTLVVKLSYTLVSVDLVDVDNNDVSLQGWLQMQWQDVQLTWNASQHGGVTELHVSSQSIWKPDVSVYNGPDSSLEPTLAIVFSDGRVTWVPPLKTTVKCNLKAMWYPFDVQNCSVVFGSWTHDASKIDLQIGVENPNEFTHNKEWTLVSLEHKRFEKKYNCCENAYPSIEAQLTIRRRGCKSLLSKAMPVATIALLGLLTMMIPATRAEIRLLIVTLLLSSAVVTTDFADVPEAVNAMSLFNGQMILTLVGLFLCNCMHLAILRGSIDTSVLEKLAGLVSSNEKSENLISNVEQRYHRTLDTLFTAPLSFLLILTSSLLALTPFF